MRYCITCGKTTTQRNDSLYVCEAGHENWINPAAGAVVCIVEDGRLLYGVRSEAPNQGKLDLPGGFIEVNETAEQAAIREAKEEVGVDVELLGLVGTYTGNYQGRPSLDIVFAARMKAGQVRAGDDLRGGKPVWRALNDLPGPDEVADIWFPQAQQDLIAWCSANGVQLKPSTE